MKREGNLIDKIADIENLRLAFWKARKGKDAKKEVILFRENLDSNLLLLREKIVKGKLELSGYHYFKIFEPKERNICASSFDQRILHHAIMNICHSNFERFQIETSYASRKGKGTYAAINQAKIYQKKYQWFLKLDVRKYFDKIDHEILIKLIRKRFKDELLIDLFIQIIDSYDSGVKGIGVPIGNLTSQYFANHYLGLADHFIKEKLKAKAYVRYMDDMVMWSNCKIELIKIGREFESFILTELKLDLKPFCLNNSKKGLPFLGYTLFPKQIKLNNTSKKRFKFKLKLYFENYQTNKWCQKMLQNHLLPLISFVEFADTFNYRRFLLAKLDTN